MRIALLLPDGVGVRNFLLGGFLRQVGRRTETHILHNIPEHLLNTYKCSQNSNHYWYSLIQYQETPVSFTLRYCLDYAQMFWADTFGMRYNRSKKVKGAVRTRAARRFARWVGRLAAAPDRIQLLDRQHCRVVERRPEVEYYRNLFQKIRPSVLFCSHQRPAIILPPVLAARSLGIPTAIFIFSWDNLTSKGRIAAPFDHYLVWSEHMSGELLRYYPDVAPDRVHIVGTPQFDPYSEESLLWSRQEFFQRVGANPSRPVICYSGGDTGTCPEDQQHVRVLMELIRAGRIEGNPQVVLRPAPVDEGTRYDSVRHAYPEMIYAPPSWIHTQPGDWSRSLPLPEDVQFLANLTFHSDLNINMASTMTLDFAIHDKPVVNIAFDVADPPPFGVPLWDFYYRYEHYRPVVELGAARFARSSGELAEHVNAYLQDPSLDRDSRSKLVNLEVGHQVGQSSRKILQVLESISR
jgi:hypothetical protein